MPTRPPRSFLPLLLLCSPVFSQEPDTAQLEKQRCPKPKELALVFSFGYAGDNMPPEDARFEELLEKIKEAGFNTVHCTYTEERLELCKKHSILMMVDLLSVEHHHVYKSPEKAKAVCEKLRNNPTVWGYNIWNDSFRKTGEGRRRDVNAVRQWDPTHPAFCGTYRVDGMGHLANADLLGYYDYHWKRGPDLHFPHLLRYRDWAAERDAWFYRWIEVDAGIPGKGNFNRCLYSVNTSLACGLKGVLWFLGTELMDRKTLEWTTAGQDVGRVNKEVLPLREEMARLGNPVAIHSTAITRTLKDEPLPDGKASMMPPGLEKREFPADFWAKPVKGEFVAGVFKAGKGPDHLFLANHNAYAGQDVELKLADGRKVQHFNRRDGKWAALEVKDGVARLKLEPGGGELLRVEK